MVCYLHSTMYLLILPLPAAAYQPQADLHSTMYLLIRARPRAIP